MTEAKVVVGDRIGTGRLVRLYPDLVQPHDCMGPNLLVHRQWLPGTRWLCDCGKLWEVKYLLDGGRYWEPISDDCCGGCQKRVSSG